MRAVEMVRRIREAQYEHLKTMTREERIDYYRIKAERLWTKLDVKPRGTVGVEDDIVSKAA